MARLDTPEKHWKFSLSDLRKRRDCDDIMHAYENEIPATATKQALERRAGR